MRILIALSLFFNLSYAQLLSTSGSQIVDDNNQEIILKGAGRRLDAAGRLYDEFCWWCRHTI